MVICKVCTKEVRTSDRNTPQPETASVKPKQTTLTQAFDKGTPYDKTSKRWKEVTEAVTFLSQKISFKSVYIVVKCSLHFAHVGNVAKKRIKICSEMFFGLNGLLFFFSLRAVSLQW